MDYSIKFYPHFIIPEGTGCFVVPIKPQYHEELFPDISDWDKGLFGNSWETYNTPARTIKKAYICHANTQQINSGDLLLFYRTEDRKNIEVIGIVEKTFRSKDAAVIISTVSKRTVFTNDEIDSLTDKECLIVLFRLQKYLMNPTGINKMQSIGIKGSLQTIRKITEKQFRQIIEKE